MLLKSQLKTLLVTCQYSSVSTSQFGLLCKCSNGIFCISQKQNNLSLFVYTTKFFLKQGILYKYLVVVTDYTCTIMYTFESMSVCQLELILHACICIGLQKFCRCTVVAKMIYIAIRSENTVDAHNYYYYLKNMFVQLMKPCVSCDLCSYRHVYSTTQLQQCCVFL